MIRVLLVIDHLGGGGAQEIVFQLCRRLRRAAVEPSVVSFHSGGLYLQKLQDLGVKVHVLLPKRSPLLFPLLVYRLFRFVSGRDFDVMHTFLPGGLLLSAPVARLKGLPIVHSVLSIRNQPPAWYFPLMWAYQSIVAAYIVIQEEQLRRQGISQHKLKIAEVLMDFDQAYAVHAGRKAYRPEAGEQGYIVLSAARLHPHKGHDIALRAWPRVLARHPRARLWIAGSGPDEARLRGLVHTLGLKESVEFLGYQEQLEQAFAQSDLFLRTSINEGINLVTLLAMAAGMPIIVIRTDVPKDYITHGYTGWTSALDEHNLAEAIVHLLDSAELRRSLGSQAHNSIQAYYDAERIVQFHGQLYRAVQQRQPAQLVPSMQEQVWPAYNPFVRPERSERMDSQSTKQAPVSEP